MLIFLISIFLIYTIIKIALEILEINFINLESKKSAVILDDKTYKEAAMISVTNKKFEITTLVYDFIIAVLWLSFGLKILYSNIVLDNTIAQNLIFVMSYIVISSILGLPFEIYSKFVKDRKFGFSTIDKKTFILDFLKSFALTIVFGSLFVYLILLCIEFLGASWWIWAAILSFVIILIINFIYPTIIAPMFNKMKALEDKELQEGIEGLMQKCGFKSSGIFTIDASKRDNRLNAYFGGLGASKRVVLFDTLIQKLSVSEILAVLGHELGHFKNKDIIRNLVFASASIFVMFLIFGKLPNSVFNAVGIDKSGGAIVIMLMILSPLLAFFITPIQSKMSRSCEFRADEFGAEIQDKNDMISALKKLGSENKAFPKSHKIYSDFYHSHPTLYERIIKLENDNI